MKLFTVFFKIKYKINQYYAAFFKKNPQAILALDFIRQDRIKDFRHKYDFGINPIIFDCGGYKGDWTNVMYKKYINLNPTIYTFEIVQKYVDYMSNRFSSNTSIKVFNFGLGKDNHTIEFMLSDIATSTYLQSNTSNFEIGNIVDVKKFLNDNNINKIDLLKMNIEGGEYELLEELIDSSYIIKFHDYGEWSIKRRNKIKSLLTKTHYLTYDFEWTFENWKKYV